MRTVLNTSLVGLAQSHRDCLCNCPPAASEARAATRVSSEHAAFAPTTEASPSRDRRRQLYCSQNICEFVFRARNVSGLIAEQIPIHRWRQAKGAKGTAAKCYSTCARRQQHGCERASPAKERLVAVARRKERSWANPLGPREFKSSNIRTFAAA